MNPYLPDASDPRMAGVKPLPEGLRPVSRPRRLRTTPAMRRMVAETRVAPAQLMLPAFVKEGSIPCRDHQPARPIPALHRVDQGARHPSCRGRYWWY